MLISVFPGLVSPILVDQIGQIDPRFTGKTIACDDRQFPSVRDAMRYYPEFNGLDNSEYFVMEVPATHFGDPSSSLGMFPHNYINRVQAWERAFPNAIFLIPSGEVIRRELTSRGEEILSVFPCVNELAFREINQRLLESGPPDYVSKNDAEMREFFRTHGAMSPEFVPSLGPILTIPVGAEGEGSLSEWFPILLSMGISRGLIRAPSSTHPKNVTGPTKRVI